MCYSVNTFLRQQSYDNDKVDQLAKTSSKYISRYVMLYSFPIKISSNWCLTHTGGTVILGGNCPTAILTGC